MQARELKQRLEELHEKLASMKDVDDETREQLRQLADDVRPWVETDATPTETAAALIERMGDAVGRFESEHPMLAAAVARISYALGQVGI